MSFNKALEAAGWSDEDLLAALSPPPKQGAPCVVDLVTPVSKISKAEKRSPLICSPCYVQSIAKETKRKKDTLTPLREDDPQHGLRENLFALTVQSPRRGPTNTRNPNENENPNTSRFSTAKSLWYSQKHANSVAEQPCLTTPVDDDALIEAANLDAPLQNGWTLYAHQKEAIVCCIRKKRSILAYDMVK